MNERFFLLPEEKRQRLLNAGYRVFSDSPYRKAPVSEVAEAAGISKALLFHYFRNKKEFYIYLWEHAREETARALAGEGPPDKTDLITLLKRSLRIKCVLMRRWPHMGAFTLRAFYETEPEISEAVHADVTAQAAVGEKMFLAAAERTSLRAGIDGALLYREMCWTMSGYLREAALTGTVDVGRVESDAEALLTLWRRAYMEERGIA